MGLPARRAVPLCLLLAGLGGLLAGRPASPQGGDGSVAVRLETALGAIDLAVDVAHAPITAKNFLRYVDAGTYTGAHFYRVTRPDNYLASPPNRPMMNLIQGALGGRDRDDPTVATTSAFPPIPLERTTVTGLTHVVGTLSMARGTPDSATSEFFILLDDQPSLDFGGHRFDDAQGAAAFGHVTAGLDVVRTIQQQGPLRESNHQYLQNPVVITSARRR